MGQVDAATWQALGLVLTIVGLALSFVLWTRRGAASGLRGVAWSLLPLAAGLTGVLRLAWEITDSVVDWAVRLVFSPVVWLGIAVAGLSLVLFVVSGWMRRRNPGSDQRAVGRSQRRGRQDAALPGQASAPPATAPGATGAAGRGAGRGSKAPADDDMSDIEDILRRHGIS